MKTTQFLSVPRLPLLVLLMAVLSFLFFSCSNEEMPTESNLSATVLEESAVAASKKGAPAPGEFSIAEIAIEEGFGELVKALFYVDDKLHTQLVDLFLNGKDQYTVFAPTDEAFRNLYIATGAENGITDLPAELVLDVLLYHVVEGRRAANSVVPPKNARSIETLLEVDFKVDRYATIHAVGNTANIEVPNISASNGIIHVIDAVILPIDLE